MADVYDVYKLYIGLSLQRVVLSLPKTRPPKRQTIMINRGTEMSHSYSPDGANVHPPIIWLLGRASLLSNGIPICLSVFATLISV